MFYVSSFQNTFNGSNVVFLALDLDVSARSVPPVPPGLPVVLHIAGGPLVPGVQRGGGAGEEQLALLSLLAT